METVQQILVNTYSPDAALRKHAEDSLSQLIASPGSLFAVLTFLGTKDVHRDLRLAAGIVIKNRIADYWRRENNPISDFEKEQARTVLIDILLIENDNAIRNLIAEAIKSVGEFDFPDKWPTLMPTLLSNVQSGDVLKMYNSLLAIRKLIKRYEYRPKETRGPLNDIVQTSFPLLQQLMATIIESNNIEASQVMRMCLKIFWSATMYALPTVHGIDVNLWFVHLSTLIQKRLPEASDGVEPAGQPVLPEERKVWPWWKLKKWAHRIVSHFMQRYGNPQYCGDEYEQFATFFKNKIAPVLLGPIMNTLANKAQGLYVTDDVHRMSITFLSNSVEMSTTYKIIKPHLDFVLFQVIFPTLCLSPEDIKLFSEDPVEFVRKIHDPLEDWLDPRIAAVNLLQTLARYRQKDTLPRLLPYIEGALSAYNVTPIDQRNYQQKDSVLVAMAAIAKILLESSAYAALVVPFLVAHVLPEFQSPVPYIRSRACWVVEYYSDVDWSNGTLLQGTLNGLLQGLRDPALPVQSAAACSLRLIISAKGAKELVRPFLKEIIQEYFRIMNEVENDAVLSALQELVDQFGEEIKDFAPEMVRHLLAFFHNFSNAGADDDEAAFSASQCLETIAAVLDAVQDHPDIFSCLETLILPVLQQMLRSGDDCFEYLDNCIQMLAYFTYSGDTISAGVWSLCGPLLKALDDWAYDYMTEIMTPILNFIAKDINTFLHGHFEGVPLLVMLLNTVKKTLEEDKSETEREAKAAATMLTCLISCSKDLQALHEVMPQLLLIAIQRLLRDGCRTSSLRTRVLEIVMASIHYNPALALQILCADGNVCEQVFCKLFEALPSIEKDSTQRLVVLSLGSLMLLPSEQLPPILRNNMQSMLQQMVRECVLIEENAEKEDEASDDDDDDEEDDDLDDDDDDEDDDEDEEGDGGDAGMKQVRRSAKLAVPEGGYDEDEDCLNVEDEEYRAVLDDVDRKESARRQKFLDGEPVDDEEDDHDDYTFTSPVDNMDVCKFFLEAMHAAQVREPALVASLQKGLLPEDTQRLGDIVSKVAERGKQLVSKE